MKTPPPPSYDVLIIGAGPAGSTTASYYLLTNPELKVALIDKSVFPRDKPCGDGLGPGALQHISALGIKLSEIPHNKIKRAEIHGPDQLSFSASLRHLTQDESFGITSKRIDLDNLLRRRAIELGAKFIDNTRFVSSELHNDMNVVTLENQNTKTRASAYCRILVGADGASSRVRRTAGIASNPPERTGIAVRAYARLLSQHSDRIILSFEDQLRPGYGWLFPFRDGTANVGVGMVISDYRKTRPKLDVLLDNYLRSLCDRGIHVTDPEQHRTSILPHGGRLPQLAQKYTALVGDAGSMINPLSGEGIVYGMHAAEILAQTTAPALRNGRRAERALVEYENQFRKDLSYHLLSNYIAHKLLRSRTWAKMVLGGASIDQKISETAVDFMFGDGTLTPTNATRILVSGSKYLLGSQ